MLAPNIVGSDPTKQIPKLVKDCMMSILLHRLLIVVVAVCNISSCRLCTVIGLAVARQQATHTSFSMCE